MLENLGCRVDVAGNGKEALEMVALLPYDVVFMDCEMPEMDGYAAAAEIRRRQADARHVPVIAMTAKALHGDRERCLQAGMEDYISKPVRLEDFEAALARWAPQRKKTAPAPAAPQPVLPGSVDSPALDPAVTGRLRKLASADPSLLHEIYDAFLASAADYVATLRSSAARQDAEALRRAAHALKGASANVGAQQLARLSRQVEELRHHGQTCEADAPLHLLAQEFERVQREVEAQRTKEVA